MIKKTVQYARDPTTNFARIFGTARATGTEQIELPSGGNVKLSWLPIDLAGWLPSQSRKRAEARRETVANIVSRRVVIRVCPILLSFYGRQRQRVISDDE